LVALPGPPHPAGRSTVLEQAATTLALARLADRSDGWERLRADLLLGALSGERFITDADIEAGLEAAGFPVRGRALYAMATGPGTHPAEAWTSQALSRRFGQHGGRCLSTAVGTEQLVLVSLESGRRPDDRALAGLG